MATLPDVNITQSNGNLGRVAAADDGIALLIVTGIAVGGQFALGDLLGPFSSVKDAEDKGITAAYDTANAVLAHLQISDFYEGAGEGSLLYVMVLATTVTMTQICDKTLTHAAKALQLAAGKIKLVGVSRVATVGTLADQYEADLIGAVTKAQELYVSEFAAPNHRPVQFLLEGKMFQGTVSTSKDFRTLLANRVSVVISQDADVAALNAAYAKYANVGYALGVLAAQQVNRSIARVKNGPLTIGRPALSDGTLIQNISDVNQEALNVKGVIFIKKFSGKDGYFFNDDHVCAAITDDYAFINHGRVMDKASRITYKVYLEELNDEIDVDATTGKLAISTVKQYQGLVKTAIDTQMTAKGEISGCNAFVDPAQDVNATDKIKTKVSIRKKGTSRYIDSELSFATTQL